jgi:hypothetical protein
VAKKLRPLPSAQTSPVAGEPRPFDPVFYNFLAALLAAVGEQQTQIEALRVGLNEARQNPAATYPAITF